MTKPKTVKKAPIETKKIESKEVSVRLRVKLSEWSETLTFDEIDDTLHLVDLYLNGKDPETFTPEGRKTIESWMERNDFRKFAAARQNAIAVQLKHDEDVAYAQEIMGIDYKIPMSH